MLIPQLQLPCICSLTFIILYDQQLIVPCRFLIFPFRFFNCLKCRKLSIVVAKSCSHYSYITDYDKVKKGYLADKCLVNPLPQIFVVVLIVVLRIPPHAPLFISQFGVALY